MSGSQEKIRRDFFVKKQSPRRRQQGGRIPIGGYLSGSFNVDRRGHGAQCTARRCPVLIQSSAGNLRSEMGPFEARARGYLGSPCDDLGFRRRETPTSTCTEARRRSLGHDGWQTRVGCKMEYYEAPADPWLPDAVAVPALGAELNVLYVG